MNINIKLNGNKYVFLNYKKHHALVSAGQAESASVEKL
jgi:hypothetical protein